MKENTCCELPQNTESALPRTIGPYTIFQSLGKGGMGEVFLAKDPTCGRYIALKRIKPEMSHNKIIQNRFLREAHVTSALTHPSIVPILSIQMEPPEIYYTMPCVEGDTLRQVLKKTRDQEKNGDSTYSLRPEIPPVMKENSQDPILNQNGKELHLKGSFPPTRDMDSIGHSIPSLARIFLQVCEAVAYTHSKGIIHRDLKPENIIVGKYGEVMILDWGIADFIDHLEKNEYKESNHISLSNQYGENLTKPGKIAGTLAYMPPERLKGKPSSVQVDLYALGVILYQLLTLQLPFQRKTIAAFRRTADMEELIDPIEMAPYRDIPHQLSAVCKKCLARDLSERYQCVEDLISDLKNYIEGKPEWIFLGELDPRKKEDWQFQENILLAKHIAITRSLNVTDWAAVMVSCRSFPENLRIEAEIQMDADSQGIGFLFSIPESDARKSLEEGYCLWIGSQKDPSFRLFRNNVQVLEVQGTLPEPDVWHKIRIEKIEDHIRFYFDGQLKLSFASYLPLAGTHVGLLHKDACFAIRKWTFHDGSHNVMVNCLAVPNAFLRHKLYDLALREYRRIGQSFPGRIEGREALFRAGLTLLEQGKLEKKEHFAHLALKEFEKLYRTPGALLEYLGKSLVYESLNDSEEEAKCLELALRKFPKHPQLPMLKEHIVYRMHESSLNNREAAYRIILLALRHIPDLLENPDTCALIHSLRNNWEPLPFIEDSQDAILLMTIQLAFWLRATPILVEIADSLTKRKPVNEILLANAVFCLIELDAPHLAEKFLSQSHPERAKPCIGSREQATRRNACSLEPPVQNPISDARSTYPRLSVIKHMLQPPAYIPDLIKKEEYRVLYYIMSNALKHHKFGLIEQYMEQLRTRKMKQRERLSFQAIEAWSFLLQKNWKAAEELFQKAPGSALVQEISPLHFPYGTWLHLKESKEAAAAHFGAVLDTPYPPTAALPSHFLAGRIDHETGWIHRAFWWEKKELYRQLDLFYQVVGNG